MHGGSAIDHHHHFPDDNHDHPKLLYNDPDQYHGPYDHDGGPDHDHPSHHHHTDAGHVLYCPTDDCPIKYINAGNYDYPGWVFGPAVHDH